jgi:hypothetical protein
MKKKQAGIIGILVVAIFVAGWGVLVLQDSSSAGTEANDVGRAEPNSGVAPVVLAPVTNAEAVNDLASAERVGEGDGEALADQTDSGQAQSKPAETVAVEDPAGVPVVLPGFENELAEGEYRWNQLLSRDAIFPVYDPEFAPAKDAPYDNDELVIGVAINGEAKAYAIGPLNSREMVNDTVGGVPILVTW